jgi:hypothetical protein
VDEGNREEMKRLLTILLLLGIYSVVHAEGELSLSPLHDATQGYGSQSILSVDEELFLPKLHILPTFSWTAVQGYRDINSRLDLQWQWTSRIATSVGYGYDNYQHYGDEKLASGELHGTVKFKLW